MKLFNTNLSDPELVELKDVLSAFYTNKAIADADAIWDKRHLVILTWTNGLKKINSYPAYCNISVANNVLR